MFNVTKDFRSSARKLNDLAFIHYRMIVFVGFKVEIKNHIFLVNQNTLELFKEVLYVSVGQMPAKLQF